MNSTPAGPRSPADPVGGVVYFGRLVDKIRLHLSGKLPADLQENLGKGFDARCTHFLRVSYPSLVERVQSGGSDEEILEWCFANGRRSDEGDIEVWNAFMSKRGIRDDALPTLERRKREGGFEGRADIETMFQYIDADEGKAIRPLG